MTAPTSQADFEIIYAVDTLDDALEDAIYDTQDALISEHSGLTLVTMTTAGATAFAAGINGALALSRVGVVVQRTYVDLVTRSDIAERTGVSAQNVGQWIRGERHAQHAFPRPTNLVAGGAWLWGDVNDWLHASISEKADDLGFPSLADHELINSTLAGSRRLTVDMAGTVHEVHVRRALAVGMKGSGAATETRVWISATDSAQREFALAT